MWISYTDSEVNCFHPVCEAALNRALELLDRQTQYRVLHHQYTGTLEMDFVIQNIETGKYLCVIEVKRTPADVQSARYQFQAMSYVQMNSAETEKPFYILTNLEYAICFRYDGDRPRVFQQMLMPGTISIGSFEQERDDFINRLSLFFKEQIQCFLGNEYSYLITLDEFARRMCQLKNNSRSWKGHLAVLLYEYIRGAFMSINRHDLPDIRLFHNDVRRICDEAARVNFKDIFTFSPDRFDTPNDITNAMLTNLYDFGCQNISGDSISSVLHQIVSEGHEHEGEVPTDLELGRIVACMAKAVSGDLLEDDRICDPAAGSGNLISSAINVFNLSPNQIIVNDWNPKLLELLSLRLGLNFARSISQRSSPVIENKNVSELSIEFFEHVKVVIMNPPFVAGITCTERKRNLFDRLRILTNDNYRTEVGQMPLEGVFLELIVHLVQNGTTIACVFPKTHLTARGPEAKAIRSLLLYDFGLCSVFTYPGNQIFDGVTKDTCILVGKIHETNDVVKVFSSYDEIPDIDGHRFEQVIMGELEDNFTPLMPGIVGRKISHVQLTESLNDGWRLLNSELSDGINFVRTVFEASPLFMKIQSLHWNMKRGKTANNGGSDLLFVDTRKELYLHFADELAGRLKPGMKNARLNSFVVGNGDSKFLDLSNAPEELVDEIIEFYLGFPVRGGRQKRSAKTRTQLKKLLNQESQNGFPANCVLIPRAIRKEGRVYLSEAPIFVSTNFRVCSAPNEDQALLLATWISTVFYQLNCEVASKDQEGMRKMEIQDIEETFVPDFSRVPEGVVAQLQHEKTNLTFLNLNDPQIRQVDRIWANYLFGEAAEEKLIEASRLLSFLVSRRNP